jgi:hypothetical protein
MSPKAVGQSRPRSAWAAGVLLLVASCGGGPGSADTSETVGSELILPPYIAPLEARCEQCHVVDKLGETLSDENGGTREWLSGHGAGLVRMDPAFPSPGTHYAFEWPSRARHAEEQMELESCDDCHPVDEEGIGHGVRTYPEEQRSMAFKGGENCATTCHAWLKDTVASSGFQDVSGKRPKYLGSFRPDELLKAVDSAHSKLWKQGRVPEELPMKIASFNPGCGGCHNVHAESHGSLPSCLRCHKLSGPEGVMLRERIVKRIEERSATRAPENEELDSCAYCHRRDEAPTELGSRACYNCHLSAHQPLDGDLEPHFWKGGK